MRHRLHRINHHHRRLLRRSIHQHLLRTRRRRTLCHLQPLHLMRWLRLKVGQKVGEVVVVEGDEEEEEEVVISARLLTLVRNLNARLAMLLNRG